MNVGYKKKANIAAGIWLASASVLVASMLERLRSELGKAFEIVDEL